MDQQVSGTIGTVGESSTPATHDHRKVWILTGYAASFLALCGVMAYYFSAYITTH